jgi:hypothetical protein
MACVRLHKLGLLSNDLLPTQLLPLTKHDIYYRIISLLTEEQWDDFDMEEVHPSKDVENGGEFLIYRVVHESVGFNRFRKCLQRQHRDLALVTAQPLVNHPPFEKAHPQFGSVKCSFELMGTTGCSQDELHLLSAFFTTVCNA